jgi:hypothetical protein
MSDKDLQKIKKAVTFLCCLGGVAVLAGINRLAHGHFFRDPQWNILRMCDILVAFVFAPLGVIFLWLLFRVYEGHKSIAGAIVFIVGAYFLGVGFGMHEPFNIFISTYRNHMTEPMMKSAVFFDDQLGHWVFFAGFMLISIAGTYAEILKPYEEKLPLKFILPALAVGVATAVVIFFNMAWEKTSVDIAILALTVAIVSVIHFIHSSKSLMKLPATLALYVAYGGGTVATVLYWLIKG